MVVNVSTEIILKKAKEIYGLKDFSVLEDYCSYIKMRENKKINFGTYNVLIRNRSEYNSADKLVEIIWELLKVNNILDGGYKYIEREDMKKNKRTGKIKLEEYNEKLIIIDTKRMDYSISFMRAEIKDILENCKEKIFILVDEDRVEGLINATMGEDIIWTMEIEKISRENKIDYIDKVLKRNNIKLSNSTEMVNKLAENPFWKVRNELLNIIVKCKSENICVITDEVANKKLGILHEKKVKQNNNSLEELDKMVGMQAVKKQINQILNYIKVNKKRDKMPMLHMCFLGNPRNRKNNSC